MPVYLRRNQNFTPSSLADFASDEYDESDFLQDPDQYRDELPQPFRMINKILICLVDDAWEYISAREQKRIIDSLKIRPPKYESTVAIQDVSVTCMDPSPDGSIVAMTTNSGVAVVDATTHAMMASYEAGYPYTSVHVSQLSHNVYLLASISKSGAADLYLYSSEKIYLVENLTEQQEGGSKMRSSRFIASPGAHFVGVFMENSSGTEGVLNVHKLPRDVWTKEIEQALEKSSKEQSDVKPTESPPRSAVQELDGGIEYSHSTEGPQGSEAQPPEPSEMGMGTPKLDSPVEKTGFKFTSPTVVLKVRPPTELQGISWSSPLSLLKTIDQGDVIGTGVNHQVSQAHIEMRRDIFENLHKHHLPFLVQDDVSNTHVTPTFHFLTPGRLLPQGIEGTAATPSQFDTPNALAVWWSGHNQLAQYALGKAAKDLEHRAEHAWPQAETIVSSAVSAATSLIAIGLKSGQLIIWDKYLGMARRMLQVTEENNIAELYFLDSRVCPQEGVSYPPYDTRTDCYVLVWCRNSRLYLVNCGLWNKDEPLDVSADIHDFDDADEKDEIENREDHYVRVLPIPGIPELVLSCLQNGCIYVHDILDGRILCEMTLPAPFSVHAPYTPILTVAANGQTLYVKGIAQNEEEGSSSAVHVFNLASYSTLEAYRTLRRPNIPEVVHSTVEHRLNALLAERMTQQVLRRSRMQERWHLMKGELEVMKKAAQNNTSNKTPNIMSISTIERSVVNSSPQKPIGIY